MNNQVMECNVIKKITGGNYWVLLYFPTSQLFRYIAREDYENVLCIGHSVGPRSWKSYQLDLLENGCLENVKLNEFVVDFVIPTKDFLRLLTSWRPNVDVVQFRGELPDFINMETLRSSAKYHLFKKFDWLFELCTATSDYAELISPDRKFLEEVLANPAIDLSKLP